MNQPLMTELEIRQSNALANARFEYSELQLDLFFFMLSRLRKNTGVLDISSEYQGFVCIDR